MIAKKILKVTYFTAFMILIIICNYRKFLGISWDVLEWSGNSLDSFQTAIGFCFAKFNVFVVILGNHLEEIFRIFFVVYSNSWKFDDNYWKFLRNLLKSVIVDFLKDFRIFLILKNNKFSNLPMKWKQLLNHNDSTEIPNQSKKSLNNFLTSLVVLWK